MEKVSSSPRGMDIVASTKITTTARAALLVRKNYSEENVAADAATVLTTGLLKPCEAAMPAESWSPSDIFQENNAPATKSPTVMKLLKQQLPFRARNCEEGRRILPPHIQVPPKKLFGYPERYRSPTDAMMSPVSRGLLTQNRRPARTLAPIVPPKALENTFQDVVAEEMLLAGSGSN